MCNWPKPCLPEQSEISLDHLTSPSAVTHLDSCLSFPSLLRLPRLHSADRVAPERVLSAGRFISVVSDMTRSSHLFTDKYNIQRHTIIIQIYIFLYFKQLQCFEFIRRMFEIL